MERSSAQKIKIAIIFVLLLIESFLLSTALVDYAVAGDFTPSIQVFAKIGLLMLLLSYTHSMMVGSWGGGWEQYVIVPVSISIGIFLALMLVNPIHARNMGLISALLVLYFTLRSISVRAVFVKFSPGFVLRRSVMGILFVFSIVCASVVLVNPEGRHVVNLEKNITDSLVQLAERFAIIDLTSKNFSESAIVNLDIKKQLYKEMARAIEPYRNAIAPIMAILVFSMIQGVGTVTFLVYALSIKGVFRLAKALKIIKINLIPVQQEMPTL